MMSETFAGHESEDILSAAWRVTEAVKNADGYDELSSAISLRYATRGEFNRAVEIADTINDPYTQDKTLAEVAVKCADAGEEDGAFELIDSLEDFSFQTTAASHIAVAHAAAGKFDRAVEIASGMEDNSATLAEIAHQCAAQGDYERALEIVEGLDLPLYKALALTRIADSHLQAGRVDEAGELLAQALEETDTLDDDNDRPSTLAEIALKLSEAGQAEQAAEVLSKATNEAENADYRDALLAQIAASHARLKQYDRAVEVVEKITDVYVTAAALSNLAAIEHAEEGRQADALQLLSDAFDLLSENQPEDQNEELQRRNMLALVALQDAEFGQSSQAIKAAQSIGALHEQHQALSGIAVRFARAGNYDAALQAARAMEDESYKAQALLNISRALTATGAPEQGLEALSEATRLIEKLERPSVRVPALAQAAVAYAEAGQPERCAPLFRQALTESKLITDAYQKASALISIADACAKAEYELDDETKEMLWEISVV